jgi:hypothetical protein
MGFFGMHSLRCSGCHAPLRWRGYAAVIECCYCRTHVVVHTGRITQQPATLVANGGGYNRNVVGLAVMAPVLIIVVVLSVVISRLPRETPAEIAQVSLATTPEHMAYTLGARVRDGAAVWLEVSESRFQEIEFSWEIQPRDHVTRVRMEASFTAQDEVIQRMEAQLGTRLRFVPAVRDPESTKISDPLAGRSDRWVVEAPAASLVFRSGYYGSSRLPFKVDLRVHRFDDPTWQDQIDALWMVLKIAAFEMAGTLEEDHRRALLLDAPETAIE